MGLDATNSYLAVLVLGYTVAAAAEVWLIKALDYDYDTNAPILCTILLNAYWPIQMIIYYRVRQTTAPPDRESLPWKAYIFLGISAGTVSTMRSVGINELSGMAYVICSNTEIVFAAFFSVTLLGKKLNMYQYSAIFLVLMAVMLSVYDPSTNSFGGDTGKQDGFILGVTLTVTSRLLSAFNSVLAEWCLGQNKKAAWVLHEASDLAMLHKRTVEGVAEALRKPGARPHMGRRRHCAPVHGLGVAVHYKADRPTFQDVHHRGSQHDLLRGRRRRHEVNRWRRLLPHVHQVREGHELV
mmetsp:Transcript_31998/g.84308  ORF Transcript_31998/g.84308 Transcript_31998/m.84308 type:complete len:297 (-) Transcript_31998:132-1022(-)